MIIMLDKDDPKITKFREKIFEEDLNLPLSYMNYGLNKLKRITNNKLSEEEYQNAYKASNVKWNDEKIDKVWLMPNVAISAGYEIDNNTYRGGYLTYTLKSKRAKFRSLNFKEFGFLTHQSIRACELGKKELILTVYEYNRKMTAQVRALKHKGYADVAGNILHQEFDYKGIKSLNGVDQHIFSIDFEKLFKKYDPYLLEMKNEETLPVKAKYPTQPEKYPYVVDLGLSVDVDVLQKEFDDFDKKDNYMLKRLNDFVISPSINIILMTYLGFRSSVYQGVSLNKPGSLELKESVGPATRDLLDKFDDICRVNYITTHKGWKTKSHKDHEDYTTQGFRIIIPFAEMKMTFEKRVEYMFKPGRAYFVNVAVEHVGEHASSLNTRTGILFKMCNDKMIWDNV